MPGWGCAEAVLPEEPAVAERIQMHLFAEQHTKCDELVGPKSTLFSLSELLRPKLRPLKRPLAPFWR